MNASSLQEPSLISADLLLASYRSDTFPQEWSAEERRRAFDRYAKWLQLSQRHPKARLAPTRDIDLFWHLHMLAPIAYVRDCVRLFGHAPGGLVRSKASSWHSPVMS